MTKQTIMTMPVEHVHTGTRVNDDGVIVHRATYSIDGYSPVLVTIKVYQRTASLLTTTLPGGGWWREPNASTCRRLMDEVLHKENMLRTGPRETLTANGWFHVYPIGPAA